MSEAWDLNVDLDTSVGVPSEGIHPFRCEEVLLEPSKAKDSKNLVFTFASRNPEEEGRQFRTWISLKESVRWKLTELVQAFGIEPVEGSDGKPVVKLNPELFEGKTIRILIEHEDYDGRTSARPKRFLPYESGDSVEDAEDDLPFG